MKGESTEYMSKNIAVFNNTTGVAESMKSLFAGGIEYDKGCLAE